MVCQPYLAKAISVGTFVLLAGLVTARALKLSRIVSDNNHLVFNICCFSVPADFLYFLVLLRREQSIWGLQQLIILAPCVSLQHFFILLSRVLLFVFYPCISQSVPGSFEWRIIVVWVEFCNIFCSPVIYAEKRLQGSHEVAKYKSVCQDWGWQSIN